MSSLVPDGSDEDEEDVAVTNRTQPADGAATLAAPPGNVSKTSPPAEATPTADMPPAVAIPAPAVSCEPLSTGDLIVD